MKQSRILRPNIKKNKKHINSRFPLRLYACKTTCSSFKIEAPFFMPSKSKSPQPRNRISTGSCSYFHLMHPKTLFSRPFLERSTSSSSSRSVSGSRSTHTGCITCDMKHHRSCRACFPSCRTSQSQRLLASPFPCSSPAPRRLRSGLFGQRG